MRGRGIGRSNPVRRDAGGRMGDSRQAFRGSRGRGEYRVPRRDDGRRPDNRDEFRRSDEGPYERDSRRPPFDDAGPFRDNRRGPPMLEPHRAERRAPAHLDIERRSPHNDFRPPRENFRGSFSSRGFPHSRPSQRPLDMDVKHRSDSGGNSRDAPSAMSRLSPKKRPAGNSPLRDDDLRKRLRRNFRSKSPTDRDFDSNNSRKERPEFRGPEENVQFNRADLRKLQIRISKPQTDSPPRRFAEPPSRRPVSPEPMYPPREVDRARPRQDSFGKGPYRDPAQSWDNDIALHRMKNDFARNSIDSEMRKPYLRDDVHRDAMPDRRGPESGRGRGGGRGQGRDRRDRLLPSDRSRYDNHSPQDQRDRNRMVPRETLRYGDMPPKRGRSYAPYDREGPPPHFNYPSRRPPHNQVY